MKTIKDGSLYLVSSEEYSAGRTTLETALEAAAGGIDILQMREKSKTGEELFSLGIKLRAVCSEKGVTFIVNDDPYLAADIDADGVHLGQEDMKRFSVAETRGILGAGKIIGVSTHSFEQFSSANEDDVDYIAFGPIFHTGTKDYFIGYDDIGKVVSAAKKPVVFIGGINDGNIDIVLDRGGRSAAVIRAITQAPDIRLAARVLKEKIMKKVKDAY
ncbi:MAG: thiamine phosphate synthase [Candidatus Omnitrophota bacterium]